MTQEQKEMLKKSNIDVDDAMERFLDNEELYMKFLLKFQEEDENFQKMKEALKEDKGEEDFKLAHTVKGVAGNLSINGLYEVIVPYVEYLRHGDVESAKSHLAELEKVFEDSMEAIRRLKN